MYRLSGVEGVMNTPKLGEHTNVEVIIDVVLRVVVALSSIVRRNRTPCNLVLA